MPDDNILDTVLLNSININNLLEISFNLLLVIYLEKIYQSQDKKLQIRQFGNTQYMFSHGKTSKFEHQKIIVFLPVQTIRN